MFHDSGDNDEKSLSDILVTSVSDYALKDSRLSTYVDYLDGPVLQYYHKCDVFEPTERQSTSAS